MNRRIFIIFAFCFLLSAFGLSAQDTWVKSYAPFGSSYLENYTVRNIAICQDGGYAVNGTYIYDDEWPNPITIEFGFLMKTDSDGNFQWAKKDTVTFIERTESLAFVETDDGGFISAVTNSTIGGGNALIKRNSNGSREWVMDNDEFQAWSMVRTSDGNIVLSGILNLGLPAIRKIDQTGTEIWTQTYNPDNERETGRLSSIIETSDGGLAATGYIQGNNFDIIVLKTDSEGDSLWTRTYDGYGDYDYGLSISETNDQCIIIGGTVDESTFTHNGILIKFSYFGEIIFEREYNSTNCYVFRSIITNNQQNIISYGRNTSGINLNAYNINGDSLWIAQLTFYHDSHGDKCLIENSIGGYLCVGMSYGQVELVITKTDENGQVTSVDNHLLNKNNDILDCYPNPFNPIVNIDFSLKNSLEQINLSIYNIKGQLIKDIFKTSLVTQGIHTFQWDGRNFNNQNVSSGIYYVILESQNNIIKAKKIIMLK